VTRFAPTFSRLDLARHCLYPWTGGVKWPPFRSSPAACYGSAVSLVAQGLADGATPAVAALAKSIGLSDEDTERLIWAEVFLRRLLEGEDDDQWRKAEVTLALDPDTGVARELGAGSSLPGESWKLAADGEMTGTPDLVRMTRDGILVVRDYKTGQYMKFADPSKSGQLRALALAAARIYQCAGSVVVELAQVDDDGVVIRSATFDAFDLDAIGCELAEMYRRLDEPAKLCPGRHCTAHFCPMLDVCPATKQTALAVTKAAELAHPLTVDLISPEHAAYVRERLLVAKAFIADLEAGLKSYATHTPIPLGDGRVWGAREQKRESIKMDAGAAAVLAEHLGPDGAAIAIEQSTSKAAIHRAVMSVTERGGGAALEKSVLAALRAAGALRESTWVKFEEFKPQV